MDACLFCGSTDGSPTTEHVLPKWARTAFEVPGSLTLYSGEGTDEEARRRVAGLPALNVTLDDAICQSCNNEFLSRIERAVRPVLAPMIVSAEPTDLDASALTLLATWAVKTVWLFELAVRQHYPGRRPIEGYGVTGAELAWMWRHEEPPPGSLVWLGCWDCQRTAPLTYEPSGAHVPTADGHQVPAHLTTLAVGYAAFQVLTVDFVAVDAHGGGTWNTRVPRSLAHALPRIWPRTAPPSMARALVWPPPAFAHDDWARLVTWDGVLRPGDPPLRTP
jgi:hypothetical protein